jgi:hypothetical protein
LKGTLSPIELCLLKVDFSLKMFTKHFNILLKYYYNNIFLSASNSLGQEKNFLIHQKVLKLFKNIKSLNIELAFMNKEFKLNFLNKQDFLLADKAIANKQTLEAFINNKLILNSKQKSTNLISFNNKTYLIAHYNAADLSMIND